MLEAHIPGNLAQVAVGPFELAILHGDAAAAREHLRYGADPNSFMGPHTVLMIAADFARPEVVRLLIDAGAEVNAVAEDGRTPLLSALWSEHSSPEVVAMLLAAGADVAVRDANYGLTPLEWAVKAGKDRETELIRGRT